METNKHWKGDTLNSSGSKVIQFRNDNRLFAIKSGDTEILLNKIEANCLLSSLKRILNTKRSYYNDEYIREERWHETV